MVGGDEGPLATDLVRRLERVDRLEVRRYTGREDLLTAVERGQAEAGVVIPPGYDGTVGSGGSAAIGYVARPGTLGAELRLTVASALDEQATVLRAGRFAEAEGAGSFEDAIAAARRLAAGLPTVSVRVTNSGTANEEEDEGRFDVGASQQLILFMFVTSLGASGQLIETRRLGVARRMLSTPTAARTVIAGETLGRLAVALFQGLVIVLASLLLFGVDWGDPLAAALLVVLFALVGTGAAMLLGSVLDNAQQAGSLGTFFGLGFAALGGCMVPLEAFPESMRLVAHITPHAWAVDGFADILGGGGNIGEVLPEAGVLAGIAAVLLMMAVWRFRRSITA